MRSFGHLLLVVGCGISALAGTPQIGMADEWTDVSGQHTMTAEFMGMWEGKAVFALPGGQRRSIELKNLRAESRLRAIDLAEERAAHLEKFKAQIQAETEEARAPGPAEMAPAPETAPSYQTLDKNASLQITAEHIASQWRSGHARVYWDTMPAKQKAEIEALVVEFAKKVDPELWNGLIENLDRTTRLLASREDWIFEHPQVMMLTPIIGENARHYYRSGVGLVQQLVKPEAASLDRLKEGNLDGWIDQRDSDTASYVYHLMNLANVPQPPRISVDIKDDTHGTVSVAAPQGTPQSGRQTPRSRPEKWSRVEGQWIADSAFVSINRSIKTNKESIANMPASLEPLRAYSTQMQEVVDSYIAPLESANSREEFNVSLDEILPPLLMKAAQFGGRAGNARGGMMGSGMEMEPGGSETEMYENELYENELMEGPGGEPIMQTEP